MLQDDENRIVANVGHTTTRGRQKVDECRPLILQPETRSLARSAYGPCGRSAIPARKRRYVVQPVNLACRLKDRDQIAIDAIAAYGEVMDLAKREYGAGPSSPDQRIARRSLI